LQIGNIKFKPRPNTAHEKIYISPPPSFFLARISVTQSSISIWKAMTIEG